MKQKVFLEKYNFKKLEWLHEALWFAGAFAVLFVVFRFVIGFSQVDGLSMYPTLYNGEYVVYWRPDKTPEVGDIVCVWVPSGHYYVKRVIAVGGDTVDIKDGQVYVNGQPEANANVYCQTLEEEGAVIYPYTVSEGDYFVMGDNREVSVDSRTFGEVSQLQIRGKIIFGFGGEK